MKKFSAFVLCIALLAAMLASSAGAFGVTGDWRALRGEDWDPFSGSTMEEDMLISRMSLFTVLSPKFESGELKGNDMWYFNVRFPPTLEGTGQDFDSYVEEVSKTFEPNQVAIIYVEDINKGYIHIGSDISPDCDTSAALEALCAEGYPSLYYRLIYTLYPLWEIVDNGRGELHDKHIHKLR